VVGTILVCSKTRTPSGAFERVAIVLRVRENLGSNLHSEIDYSDRQFAVCT
jgi:hypothetical protein